MPQDDAQSSIRADRPAPHDLVTNAWNKSAVASHIPAILTHINLIDNQENWPDMGRKNILIKPVIILVLFNGRLGRVFKPRNQGILVSIVHASNCLVP